MEQIFYMMKDILLELEKEGYKISRPTFQEYEKNGLILPSQNYAIMSNGREVRLYTKEEVKMNAERIIAFIKQKRARTLL